MIYNSINISIKRSLVLQGFLFILCVCVSSGLYAQNASNPILYTDVPDPDVLRVGDTYYMSSTTMQYNPGIPIMKSTDLANWELVNYCYDVMDNNAALNLENGQEAYSGGTWASSFTHHDGRFYVSSFSYSTNRTYIYHTADIENGPWEKITIDRVFHDHSLFFDDDGRVYMAYGHDNVQLTELRPDLTGVQPGGVDRVIIENASSVAGNDFVLTAEGTRLQKFNGYYYVSNICWPSGSGRTQILHRASSLTGNYEGRVVFQSDIGSAQGEYIETAEGNWYAMFFHDHGALGRIPDLLPVTWNDGWPTVGENGQVPSTVDITGDNSLEGIIASDEFNNTGPLQLQWQWNHNPQNNYWSLSERPGYLRLTNDRVDPNVQMTRNTLTQRTYGPESTGYVELDVSGMENGDYAGLVAMQYDYGFVGVKMENNNKQIVMASGSGWENNHTEIANVPLNQNTVFLRIDFDYTNRVDDAFFYYSLDGDNWEQIGNKLDMSFMLEHFVGYRFGLFSYGTATAGGYADFNFFRVGDDIADASNVGPSVSFVSPTVNATYTEGESILLEANANSPNASITNIQFYQGNTLLHTDNTAPYTYEWDNAISGSHQLRAVVNTDANESAEATVTIRVNVPQGPYNNSPLPIPGMIQAEEFDVGGNGFAYNDDTPGSETGVDFRTGEDVDIEESQDTDGGYNIGYATAGEWLEYTVDVSATDEYDLDLRVAKDGDGGEFHIEMDGEDITGTIAVPNTGGWQVWETVTLNDISLEEGEHIMRIVFDTDYINLNYVEFTGTVTAISDETESNVELYPNPFTSEGFVIKKAGKFNYQINNLNGTLVRQGEGQGNQLVGQNLNRGVYVLTVECNGSFSTFKIVKQ